MAVAFDAVGPGATGAQSSSSTNLSWSHSTVAASTILIVAATLDVGADGGFSLSATCDGSAMTTISGPVHTNGSTVGFLNAWWISLSASGSHSIVVTAAGGTPTDMDGGSISFSGAAGIGTPATPATGNSTAPSITVSPTTSGNVVCALCGDGSALTSSSPATSRFTGGTGGGAGAGFCAGETSDSTGSPVTAAWTAAIDFWAVIAVEVQASAAGVEAPVKAARPGKTWRRRFRHRQFPPQFPAVAAAAATGGAPVPQRPQIPGQARTRARLGGRGLCAAGILATGIGPPPVPAPHQPPAISHPPRHRAQWDSITGSPPAAQPQSSKPATIFRRTAHRAIWDGIAGSPPPVVQGGGSPQPFRPVTIYRRTPHAALWRAGRGLPPAAQPQPSRPVTVFTRPRHRAVWDSITGPAVTVAPSLGNPQPFKPPTVYRRIAHGAIWRTITGRPPAATPQPTRPPTVFRRVPHRALWDSNTGTPPAAKRQPFRPVTVYLRAVHRALWRAITGQPPVFVPPPPFTIGALTTADQATSAQTPAVTSAVLTAQAGYGGGAGYPATYQSVYDTEPGGQLTASDQRTGGPG